MNEHDLTPIDCEAILQGATEYLAVVDQIPDANNVSELGTICCDLVDITRRLDTTAYHHRRATLLLLDCQRARNDAAARLARHEQLQQQINREVQ